MVSIYSVLSVAMSAFLFVTYTFNKWISKQIDSGIMFLSPYIFIPLCLIAVYLAWKGFHEDGGTFSLIIIIISVLICLFLIGSEISKTQFKFPDTANINTVKCVSDGQLSCRAVPLNSSMELTIGNTYNADLSNVEIRVLSASCNVGEKQTSLMYDVRVGRYASLVLKCGEGMLNQAIVQVQYDDTSIGKTETLTIG